MVTQVEVDPNDPAFAKPTKPVGPFYTAEEAKKRMSGKNEIWIEDSGRGWRRVVPSPDPKKIVEGEVIKHLSDERYLVIACGGGGIPVIKDEDGTYRGVEAVIDKDLAGAFLARELSADLYVMATDVQGVYLDWGTPRARLISRATPDEISRHEFPAGSMGPKVEAACRFVRETGNRAAIGALSEIGTIISGSTGTHVVPGHSIGIDAS